VTWAAKGERELGKKASKLTFKKPRGVSLDEGTSGGQLKESTGIVILMRQDDA